MSHELIFINLFKMFLTCRAQYAISKKASTIVMATRGLMTMNN